MSAEAVIFAEPGMEFARAVAADMRLADRLEVEASGGYTPLGAAEACLDAAGERYALEIRGEVAAIYGVAETDQPDVGVIWLLGTTAIDRHPRTFWRMAQLEVERLSDRWGVLVNAVDARYLAALRFVARLGFVVYPAAPFGVAGLPFHRIELRS